ncbi:hypothetical protein DFJ73DRAFT_927366 [Zopfochytrium polystomum]|nr:hypothetical protein DFJ73DRAFT_927366 [Zopfochytrium polystomum]
MSAAQRKPASMSAAAADTDKCSARTKQIAHKTIENPQSSERYITSILRTFVVTQPPLLPIEVHSQKPIPSTMRFPLLLVLLALLWATVATVNAATLKSSIGPARNRKPQASAPKARAPPSRQMKPSGVRGLTPPQGLSVRGPFLASPRMGASKSSSEYSPQASAAYARTHPEAAKLAASGQGWAKELIKNAGRVDHLDSVLHGSTTAIPFGVLNPPNDASSHFVPEYTASWSSFSSSSRASQLKFMENASLRLQAVQ